jgi:acetyltransferase-like isoleucine patch superfamily enzyme
VETNDELGYADPCGCGCVNDVVIGAYVTVGAHSCILLGARLPDGSAFGAYSLITSADYQPLGFYVGIRVTLRRLRSVKTMPQNF